MEQTTTESRDPQILLVEDDPSHARLMRARLRKFGTATDHAATQADAIRMLGERDYDLLLLDMKLPDGSGFLVQEWLSARSKSPSIVFVTADDLAEHAIKAIHAGAADYVVKRPNYLSQMVETVSHVLDARMVQVESSVVDDMEARVSKHLLGRSPAMVEVRRRVVELSRGSAPVLISGEAGTGKSSVSRLLHANSNDGRPFVVASCRELSERFDAEYSASKRSFDSKNFFEAASGGTLVLEEVSEATPELQVEMTRMIDRAEQIGFRIIAETSYDLGIETAEGRFLEPLWFRVAGMHVHIAPLRDRAEDVADIALQELRRLSRDVRGLPYELDQNAWRALVVHPWKGNVRELLYAIRKMVGAAGSKRMLDRYDLDAAINAQRHEFNPRSQYETRERTRLRTALDRNKWNVSATARSLKVSRGWIRRRMAALGL